MNPILTTGVIIVHLALICYSIGIITEQRRHKITAFVIRFLTIGVILDITATVCMIAGSTNSPFSPHGILGYSSLAAMLLDTILAWRHRQAHSDGDVPKGLHLYSRFAYCWWLLAYITGIILVMMK